ncbi:MAG: DUF1549 and DUF1553 domain-containing protein [Planctomycetota bacterium]
MRQLRQFDSSRNAPPCRFAKTRRSCFILFALFASSAIAGDAVDVQSNRPASERFAQRESRSVPDFQRHVVPLLGRLGCNSAKCHGSFQGQGELRLSLFGFDFQADHLALRSPASSEDGHRLSVDDPENSLIVLKATEQLDHEGGRRFEVGSWEHHLLLRWIELGAKGADSDGSSLSSDNPAQATSSGEAASSLVGLRYEPSEILFQEDGQTRQLRIIAEWEDGTEEDVTCLARFQTNDPAIASVSPDGLATSTGTGDTHIVAFYDNGVAAIPVLSPYTQNQQGFSSQHCIELIDLTDDHPIDQFVNAKLGKLGLTPSQLCTDSEFLRRVSIDLTGTLPTPDEVIEFVDDESAGKRDRKIDELLRRPSYAAWWTNKLCDFTGCNPKSINSLLEVALEDGYVKASEWYDWILQRVEQNEPYDRIVAGLMLADLSGRGDGMPHFWTRQSLEEPKDTAMSVAHAFLGIQLQCAECHKHPFDRWTQADFNDFAQFFDSVTTTKRRPEIDKELELRLLRSGPVRLKPGDDPRRPIMEWMRHPENPWFARAFVNRVWAGYFNRGIVEPPDQFTPANPPSHPQLLEWLASGFAQNGYDMKWLHRQITSSRTYQRSWKPNETNRKDRRNFSRTIPRRIPAEVVYDAMKQVTAASDDQDEVRTNLRRRASGHLSMRMAGTHAMKVFGKPDRTINCDCERVNEPTLLQAIFTQNDPLLRMRLAESGWMIEIEDAETDGIDLDLGKLVEDVWLRTVGRTPTEADSARAFEHLSGAPSIAEGVGDLLWAMMNSKEFLLNH